MPHIEAEKVLAAPQLCGGYRIRVGNRFAVTTELAF